MIVLQEFLEQNKGARMVLMSSHATKAHSEFEFHDGDYIVFGREDAGVPDDVHALFGENQCRIPMIPNEEARCFNLATSGRHCSYGSGTSIGVSKFKVGGLLCFKTKKNHC